MNELKNRGIRDLLIAVVDGSKGFPDAITAVLPQTIVQTCIIHLIRHSIDFASWKKTARSSPGVWKTIYRAKDADAARAALEAFAASQRAKISRHRAELAQELGAGDPRSSPF
jgi:putative transposase